MANQAIDFMKYHRRRESRKLVARVVELAEKNVAWSLGKRARNFLRESRLHVVDLTHVLCSARDVRPGQASNEFVVEGFTVDEVLVRLLVRDDSGEQPPSLACVYGKLLTDEEDLVG